MSCPAAENLKFSVKELGPLSVQGDEIPVLAHGGNYSVPFEEGGKTLWLLSNIWLGETKEGAAHVWGVSDCGAAVLKTSSPYETRDNFEYFLDENKWPVSIFAPDAGENVSVRKLWPRSGLVSGTTFYVYYSIIHNYGTGAYDFFRVGQGIAFSDNPFGPYSRIRYKDNYALWNDIEPAPGMSVLAESDGWIYAYGRIETEPGRHALTVARVKPDEIVSREAYSYYSAEDSDGNWSRYAAESAPLLENVPEEFSISYNERLKKYLLIYFDAESDSTVLRTAEYPWGKFSEPVTLLTCSKEDYCYGAREHAEFSSAGGAKIFITIEKKNIPYFYEIHFQ